MSSSFARNLKTKIHVTKSQKKISKRKTEKLQIDLDEYTISHVNQQIGALLKEKK